MEEISQLIKIITRHTKKNLPLIDLKAQEDGENKELKLFLGIKNSEFESDEIASKGIYGEKEVDFKFRMLKSRLNKKLLNHLFFMDYGVSKMHKSLTFHQECMDYYYFSKHLLKIGEVKLATKLLYKTIDLAKECEYNDILLGCLKELRDIYSSTYRPKLFQSTHEEITEYEALVKLEEEADTIYFEQKLFFNSSITNRKKDLKPVKNAIKSLEKLYQKTESYNIFEKQLKLIIWLYEYEGKYEEVLKFVDRTETDFMKGNINQTRLNLENLKIARLYALLKLNQLVEGEKYAQAVLEEIDKDSLNYFAIQENYLQIVIRKDQMDEAVSIVNDVFANKSFPDLNETQIERWQVYRAYLYYLTGEKSLTRKINYKDMVEVIPEFQKDKAGVNLAILILQVLTHVDDDIGKLHEILSAIDDYTNKYLNNTFSKRTKVFCKLLHKIVSHNRDFDQIMQKSKYLTDKLAEIEIEGDIYADIEIVPYEKLWDMITKRLSILRYQSV